jgi:hypothetical protein
VSKGTASKWEERQHPKAKSDSFQLAKVTASMCEKRQHPHWKSNDIQMAKATACWKSDGIQMAKATASRYSLQVSKGTASKCQKGQHPSGKSDSIHRPKVTASNESLKLILIADSKSRVKRWNVGLRDATMHEHASPRVGLSLSHGSNLLVGKRWLKTASLSSFAKGHRSLRIA